MASRCFSPPDMPVAPLADDGVVPVGQCGDGVVDLRRPAGRSSSATVAAGLA